MNDQTEPEWVREGAELVERATGTVWWIWSREEFDDGPWYALNTSTYLERVVP